MAYVVAEPCIKCRYTECVTVCPVECFREGANSLVINPYECIECGVCVDECPVHAIFPSYELPEKWAHYAALNAKYSSIWPPITKSKGPLPDAEQYKDVEDKAKLFDPNPGEGTV